MLLELKPGISTEKSSILGASVNHWFVGFRVVITFADEELSLRCWPQEAIKNMRRDVQKHAISLRVFIVDWAGGGRFFHPSISCPKHKR